MFVRRILVVCWILFLIPGAACFAEYSGFPHYASYPTIPTYEGSNQTIHPSVLYFPGSGWNGNKFWMGNTPYPYRQSAYENPSIFAGNDMTSPTATWTASLSNPIQSRPAGAYYADTDIVYNDQTDEIWCYYIENAGGGIINLILQKSSDGLTWSDNQILKTWDLSIVSDNSRSPAVVKRGTDDWRMWAETGRNHAAKDYRVEYYTSSDGENWSAPTLANDFPVGAKPWHLDVNYIPERDEYWMFFSGYETDIYFAIADASDPTMWDVYETPAMTGSRPLDGTAFDKLLYRPTFLYNIDGQGKIHLWYGAYGYPSSPQGVASAHTGYSVTTYAELAEYIGAPEPNTPPEPPETITEDFTTDPSLDPNSWVDHIPGPNDFDVNLWWTNGYVRSNNIARHVEDGYYLPLSLHYNQDSSLRAKFRIFFIQDHIQSFEVFRVGFFNKDEWFDNPDPDNPYDAENTVDATFQQAGTHADAKGSLRATCLPDDCDPDTERRESDPEKFLEVVGGQYFHLIYTAGAGANSAGQVVVDWYGNDSTYTTLVDSVAADLEVGDTFNVNSFGIFTGHMTDYPDTGATQPALDDVEITISGGYAVCGDSLHPYPAGDITGPEGDPDCRVDMLDFAVIGSSWLECTAPECD